MTTRVVNRDLPQAAEKVSNHSQDDVCGCCHYEPHEVERAVLRELLSIPDVKFSSLEVHRTPNSICLSGVVRVTDCSKVSEIEKAASRAAGILNVVNCLMARTLEDNKQCETQCHINAHH